jgi:hypothetical protein
MKKSMKQDEPLKMLVDIVHEATACRANHPQ